MFNIPKVKVLGTVLPPVMTMAVVGSVVFEESRKRFEDTGCIKVKWSKLNGSEG
jgi:hypothetical protein